MSIGHDQSPRPQGNGPDDEQYRIPFGADEEQVEVEERTARTHERLELPADETSRTGTERVSSAAELEAKLAGGSKGLGAAALNFFRTPFRRIMGGAAAALVLAGVVTVGVKASNNSAPSELQPGQTTSAGAAPAETTLETPTQEVIPELRAPSVETATPENLVIYFTGKDSEPIVGLEAAKKSLEIPVSLHPTPELAATHAIADVLPDILNANTSPASKEAYGMGQVELIDQKFNNTEGTGVVDELLEAVVTPGSGKGLEAWAEGVWKYNLSASQYTGRHIASHTDVVEVTEHGGVTAKQVNVKFTVNTSNLIGGAKFGETKNYTMTSAWVPEDSDGKLVWKMNYSEVKLTK